MHHEKDPALSVRKYAKERWTHGMKRVGATIAVVVGVTGACIAWALAATLERQRSTGSAFAVSSHLVEFENTFGYYAGETLVTTLGVGMSEDPSILFLPQIEAGIWAQIAAFERFETKYKRHRRRTQRLRATRNAFRTVEREFDAFLEFEREMVARARTLTEDEPELRESFDAYYSRLVSTVQEDKIEASCSFGDARVAFVDRLADVTTETSGTTVAVAVVCAVAVVLSAAVCALVKLLKDANAKLKVKDRLARQQAHENRNKYAPAIGVLEQLLDAAAAETEPRGSDATGAKVVRKDAPAEACSTDLVSRTNPTLASPPRDGAARPKTPTPLAALSDDIHLALVALREVEALHRSRLDCFKLLEGTYVSNPETFELLEFMRGRLSVERAVAQAHHRADFPDDAFPVEYLARVEADGYRDCGALHVRCDLYVLNHVVQNLLSNSRKFTSQGRVVLTLRAATADREKGRLVFAVRDTGSGVPDAAIPKLFDQGVCTGDVRGTGLGLPSCSLFVKAAGGYIRLADTRRRGERHRDLHYPGATPEAIQPGCAGDEAAAGQGDTQECADQASFSEFEFAVQGYVVRADPEAGPDDDDDRRCDCVDSHDDKCCEADSMRDADETDPELGRSPFRPDEGPSESAGAGRPVSPGPETAAALLPRNLVVVVVDDSTLNRRVLVRAIDKVRAERPSANWTYHQFETIEASQPFLRQLHCDGAANCLVCLDEQLGSRGGVLTGIEGARWLLEDLGFAGKIVSTSGDPEAGVKHLQLGTHLSWGKPLPDQQSLLRDLCTVFGHHHSAQAS